jgi:predicted RNase H-like HicB family nuclease
MFGYRVAVCWSGKDKAFIAEVPALPGCAADGQTRQEALDSLEVVMREWLQTAEELGRMPPLPELEGRVPDGWKDAIYGGEA